MDEEFNQSQNDMFNDSIPAPESDPFYQPPPPPPPPEPKEIHHHHYDEKNKNFNTGRFFIGLIVVLVGAVLLLRALDVFNFTLNFNWSLFLAIVVIAVGLSILSRKGVGSTIFGIIIALIVLIIVVGIIFGNVQGGQIKLSGEIVKVDREVENFDKIKLEGAGNLFIEQTDEESLIVEADKNLLERISTEVEDDTLVIKYDYKWYEWIFNPISKEANYYITLDDITELSISGSSDIKSEFLESEIFELNIAGSGDVEMNIKVDEINSKVSGSGRFVLTGTADKQSINIMGSGKYYATELESKEAIVKISGSGKVKINAEDQLDVSVSGSGNVFYLGDPKINQSISGSGNVSRIEETEED